MTTAAELWRTDTADLLTNQARGLMQRLLDRMDVLPAELPDDVRLRYFRAYLRASARMRRRAAKKETGDATRE